ncbi:MAG: hypothetical protein NVSMB62_13780 [Acidobacteriaceae bacterium]
MALEDIPVPTGCSESFLIRVANIAESLANLNFLIREDANKPDLVRAYAIQSEERLQALKQLLRTNDQKNPL